MARWTPEETDTMAAIATEIVHQAGTNRTVIAVDGQAGTDLGRVAEALVRAFEQTGVSAMAAEALSTGADALRTDVVEPFRTTGAGAGVLVVHGSGVLAEHTRALWRWSMWVEQDPTVSDDRRAHASAVLDVTDPEHPRRDWADAC